MLIKLLQKQQWCIFYASQCIAMASQAINQYSFSTAWQMQANSSKQKGSTVSKKKAGLEKK